MTLLSPVSREIELADIAATERLAAGLAALARRGDVLALAGGLGLGKTSFARAFIRARPGGVGVAEVPSPTFTLVQVYDLAGAAIWHFDLYRLTKAEDAYELGIEEAFAEAICLIEWPDRLGDLLPADRLDVEFSNGPSAESRRVRLVAGPGWAERLKGFEFA
jgi:tRNA threonylcarbamoyladenosine biosynthesis protein TsaE